MSQFHVAARGVCLAVLAVLLSAVSAAAGETIIHTGDDEQLRPLPGWVPYVPGATLAPSESSLSGNRVEVLATGAITPRYVFGGLSEKENVSANSVFVSRGTVGMFVHGGYSVSGAVYNNSAFVSGGKVSSDVYGGCSEFGAAYNNSAFVSGGKVDKFVCGGLSASGTAYNNSAFVSGGTVDQDVYGGNSGSGAAYNNSVFVSGGAVGQDVYGGRSVTGAAYNNSAFVSGGAVDRNVYGGYGFTGAAYNNSVFVSGGAVDDNVYGGFSNSGAAYNNSAFVSGGMVNKHVFGGCTNRDSATGNTVTIGGSAAFSNASVIVGGGDWGKIVNNAPGAATGDLVSGNTLNIVNWSGTVGTIGNFETVNFVLPAAASLPAPVLTLAGSAADFSNMDVNLNRNPAQNNPNNLSTQISVNLMSGGELLGIGDQVILVDQVVNAAHLDNAIVHGLKGSLVEYEYISRIVGGSLVVEARSRYANPRAKVLTQSYLAPVSLLNRGGDHVASQGVTALDAAFGADLPSGWTRPAFFGSAAAGHERSKTGSHVAMDGVTFLAGLGAKNTSSFGSLVLGAYFEAGYGDYDTSSSIADRASVHSNGDTSYLGGGLLARLNLQNGLYAEGSARVGRVKNDLDGTDLVDFFGRMAAYNARNTYYGAHAGLGYLWNLGGRSSLDLYGKYFWTHSGGNVLTVTNDPLHLDGVDSHRLRGGTRYAFALSEYFSPYVGAAYEYEFDGKSKGRTYNVFRLPESSLKGGTGIAELGATCRIGRVNVVLGAQGYIGRRRGVSATARVGVAF